MKAVIRDRNDRESVSFVDLETHCGRTGFPGNVDQVDENLPHYRRIAPRYGRLCIDADLDS